MYDKELLLRDGSTNFTAANETTATVDMGPDRHPITYTMTIPLSPAATLACRIIASHDDTNWFDLCTFHSASGSTLGSGSAAGEYHATAKSNARYRRAVLTASGSTASPGFGKIVIGPQLGGIYDEY